MNKLKKIWQRITKAGWALPAMLFIIWDFLAVHGAYFLALWVRFDCQFNRISPEYIEVFSKTINIAAVLTVLFFAVIRLYRRIWRYAGLSDILWVLFMSVAASGVYSLVLVIFMPRMPVSYHLLGAMIQVVFVVGTRVSYRVYKTFEEAVQKKDSNRRRVMIIGAGAAGQLLMRDLVSAKDVTDEVVCFIDDDPTKHGRYLNSVPIVGGRDDILAMAKEYRIDKIFLAIPSLNVSEKRDILNICAETGCELKALPALHQLAMGTVTVKDMRDVSIEDLLGRKPIQPDMAEVFGFLQGKTVLVTGGGGSIGSELCRQIALHDPKQLIIFDIYENNAYDISLELKDKYPQLNLVTLIGSVRDSRRLEQVFADYRPDIVYHAAAHKHVPLMEDSPCEAIKNNVIGTYKTAYAAMINGCRRFVLISTDKAVNPTNIMGASKRLCEMVIQSFDAKIKAGRAEDIQRLFTHQGIDTKVSAKVLAAVKTEFVAVRFGNVLGSNGSVIPIFKRQIAHGGPVTVTHPDIIRYFMTIPEAVSLVLTAGTYAHGGEIFVLDMGSPVKIDTMARNLIRLSGFKPDVDIKIEYTGLRPGEKLYEEKLMAEEGLKKTDNELIHIGCPIPFDENSFLGELHHLMSAAYANDPDIRSLVAGIVPTYHPATASRPDKDLHEAV